MKTYTLAFIFTPDFKKVLLIHKLRPDWQVGKLNGLGGKIEQGEDSVSGVQREIQEEGCLKTQKASWIYVGKIGSSEWSVDIFGYLYKGSIADAKSGRDERVEWFDADDLPSNIVPNLAWLIPLTKDRMKRKEFKDFIVHYT